MGFEYDYIKIRDKVEKLIRLDEAGFAYTVHHGMSFNSFYQPIYDRDMEVYGVEALVRISDSQGNPVSPYDYFKSIEGDDEESIFSTLMCSAIHVINFSRSIYRNKCIFINVAPPIFELVANDQTAIDSLLKKLALLQLRSDQIIYEIMEFEGRDKNLAISGIRALAKSNIRVAVDDYGADHSTISRVKIIQPDFLKLDKSIVDVPFPDGKQKLKHAVGLGRDVQSLVIAEGIETQDILDNCLQCNVDLFQGFFLSRPHKTPLAM